MQASRIRPIRGVSVRSNALTAPVDTGTVIATKYSPRQSLGEDIESARPLVLDVPCSAPPLLTAHTGNCYHKDKLLAIENGPRLANK